MRVSFEEQVRAALDELPPHLAAALENVAVVVEDENPEDPDLFGLYHGVPLPERGDASGLLPDKISIYRIPLEESFAIPRSCARRSASPSSTSSRTTSASTRSASQSSATTEVSAAPGLGIPPAVDPFRRVVTPNQIHDTIEQLSEERQELWQRLSDGLDPAVKDEIKDIDARLQELWQSLRMEKARLRFGEREEIVRRARAEERLERAA